MRLPSIAGFGAASAAFASLAAPSLSQGQIVPGAFLGSSSVAAAGDVDDDGTDDYIVALATSWEVRSGVTGLAFAALTRATCSSCYYWGLRADLDADGKDDLVFQDLVARVVEFRSGFDGSLLFQFAHPNLDGSSGAADHDGDGFDDVMVAITVPSPSARVYSVLSGRNGSPIASYSFPTSATMSGGVGWCGDVNGDSYADLLTVTTSVAMPYSVITAGGGYGTGLFTNFGSSVRPVYGDTNGDGQDELWVSGDIIEVSTSQVVWSGVSFFSVFGNLDLDGDGAHDLVSGSLVLSGRTHSAFAGSVPGGWPVGDIDADGREELVFQGTVYELAGSPVASFVRTRGASGVTSNQSRPRIRHRSRPRLGDTLRAHLNGAGGANFVFLAIGTAVDLDLAPIGAPGNRAFVDPLVFIGLFADSRGHAVYALAVPNAAALLGFTASMQWAVFDPPANALGLATSNALDFIVGN